ncbi:ImmA/IrrE family metallo-endopeptidase [Arthrobacter frigidicola]|nr:ImmA/IrrE family metallo-endopeptidase [Arthrobacter frigidicola]
MPGVTVSFVRLNGRVASLTDGRRIWLDPRLTQVEQRCNLAHEIVHIERGHGSAQGCVSEMSVRAETARRLVPMMPLVQASYWARNVWELADELRVTPMVVTDRWLTLGPWERAILHHQHHDLVAA